jgi:hypothetical protein
MARKKQKQKRKNKGKGKGKGKSKPAAVKKPAAASPVVVEAAGKKGKTPKVTDRVIPASDAVRDEWSRRVEAEYRSAAIAQQLTLWLIQMGASPDLLHEGLRIAGDELVHAELSFNTFAAAGGKQVRALSRESLALRTKPNEQLEESVTRWGVEVFCLGETVAVPLFKVLREKCIVPTAREALDRVLRDEVRHRDFGWMLLEWLVEQPCEKLVRGVVERELPSMFARIRRSYAPVGGELKKKIPDDDRSWGLMPIARYRSVLERTVDRDYRPRFARLGFDADPAWKKACEMSPAAAVT